ncbi:MAG: DUF4325 domain-containing protein [Candidatus Pacebacteria bacterium]|nr:DUF4325 domain-containing protein [Candidatus Paceibacterota bacterium]
MKKDIKKIILEQLKRKNEIKVADIVRATGFSRAYINRFFKELKKEGKIILLGKANNARYVLLSKAEKTKRNILSVNKIVKNKDLSEDIILKEVKENNGIFLGLSNNVVDIFDYAFSEMLNNAIEHSKSDKINIFVADKNGKIVFEILDYGVGIFNNIMAKKKLNSEMEAIQDLLKGKQTTAPQNHSGEGIFFTSKVADNFFVQSFGKEIIFNNILDDVFVKNSSGIKGTKINFSIVKDSKKKLDNIFRDYSGELFAFSKTKVKINLYEIDNTFISRSQARRVLVGLDKFKEIILDFKDVKTVGQGFADEVFRVWKNNHPDIKIGYKNQNENILFMIKRAHNT